MHRQLIWFWCLCCISIQAQAQKLGGTRPTYLSVKDGLPDATINAICQDEDGFLWIGTSFGLSRYDGVEFKNYYHSKTAPSLPGNYIKAIQKLPQHRLLIATSTGLCLFNTSANTFKNLLIPCSAKMFPFENNFSIVAVDKQNTIWAASQTCLYQLDQNLNILQVKSDVTEQQVGLSFFLYVESIRPLPDGRVLFRLLKDKKFQFYIYSPSNHQIILLNGQKQSPLWGTDNSGIRDIAFDKHGNLWFVKHLVDSVFFLNAKSGPVTAAYFDHLPAKGQIYFNSHISLVNNQLAACSLSDGGIVYWNTGAPGIGQGSFTSDVLLPDQHVLCMLYDSESNLWVGTENGLFKFTLTANAIFASQLPAYNTEDHRGIELSDIFIVKDSIFLTTTGGGMFYTDRQNAPWKRLSWGKNVESNNTWNIRATGAGKFWIGTQQGMYEWASGAVSPRPVKWPGNEGWLNDYPIITQFTDKENVLWMGLGFGKGLAAYNLVNHSLQLYSKTDKENNMPIRFPVAIAEDEFGDLWMGGTEGRGLVKWSRANHKFTLFSPAYNTDFDNGIINSIYADHKGKIWLGTNSGLVKFDISSRRTEKISLPERALSNTVYSLAADNKGHLWMGTKNGLNCVDLRSGHFFSFSGYYQSSDDPVMGVKYDATTNKVYFNTPHLFYSIVPDELLRPRPAPKVLITSVTSTGNSLNPAGQISLPANDNNINISFSAVNLVDGAQNRYYYQLNESGKNWIFAGKTRQISFSNLQSGNYRFRVKAQLADGAMSANEAALFFSVETPFYKSWWFIIAAIAAAGCVIYGIYLNRIRQLLHVQAIRNSIATDLHDDIGSTLSNINILTELSNANLERPDQARDFLKRITEEVNSSNQSLDDIVWSINTLNDSYEQIAARMRRYAAELFEGAGIAYHIHFDERIAHKKLDMEKRKDIYLLFKEAVNNIYKHSCAANVEINLQTDQNYFQMIIADNGKGFDPAAPSARNGIKNMKIRAGKWRGTVLISSAPGKGTTLTILIPLV